MATPTPLPLLSPLLPQHQHYIHQNCVACRAWRRSSCGAAITITPNSLPALTSGQQKQTKQTKQQSMISTLATSTSSFNSFSYSHNLPNQFAPTTLTSTLTSTPIVPYNTSHSYLHPPTIPLSYPSNNKNNYSYLRKMINHDIDNVDHQYQEKSINSSSSITRTGCTKNNDDVENKDLNIPLVDDDDNDNDCNYFYYYDDLDHDQNNKLTEKIIEDDEEDAEENIEIVKIKVDEKQEQNSSTTLSKFEHHNQSKNNNNDNNQNNHSLSSSTLLKKIIGNNNNNNRKKSVDRSDSVTQLFSVQEDKDHNNTMINYDNTKAKKTVKKSTKINNINNKQQLNRGNETSSSSLSTTTTTTITTITTTSFSSSSSSPS